MKNLHIDLVSDIACPWCAIGYARLEKAMDSIKDQVSVSIQWRAFELNPDPNLIPEPILPALSKKKWSQRSGNAGESGFDDQDCD